jgi:hypothetical protein
MNSTNLVPLARQLRQARSTRIRAWSIALGAALLASGATYAACTYALADARAPAPAEFTRAAREVSQFNADASRVRAQLAGVRREAYAARSLSEQPDVSLLFDLISRTADEQIVLSRCELTESPSAGKGADEDAAAVGGAVLRLDGLATTQAAVAGFVLQLETAGLFNRVALLQSHSQPLFGQEAAAFRIECVMQPARGGTP